MLPNQQGQGSDPFRNIDKAHLLHVLGDVEATSCSYKGCTEATLTLGVLSHHLKCEMKSPHLVAFSWDLVDVWVEFELNFGHYLADFSRY